MNMTPFLEASPYIQVHTISAVSALVLGAVVLTRRKGTSMHRLLGRIWVGLMVVVALSSFFIHTLRVWGDFSPIHLISIFVLVTLSVSIYAARKGNIRTHRHAMLGSYWGGLVITGALTLVPGRILGRSLFGEGGVSLLTRETTMLLTGLSLVLVFFVLAWMRSRENG